MENPAVYFNGRGEAAGNNAFLKAIEEHGHDTDSFYGDPLFVDWEKADFRPRPNSPIHRMGITPIDLSNVGLTSAFPRRFKADRQDVT